jgi:hypothetical protein
MEQLVLNLFDLLKCETLRISETCLERIAKYFVRKCGNEKIKYP